MTDGLLDSGGLQAGRIEDTRSIRGLQTTGR